MKYGNYRDGFSCQTSYSNWDWTMESWQSTVS